MAMQISGIDIGKINGIQLCKLHLATTIIQIVFVLDLILFEHLNFVNDDDDDDATKKNR